MIKLIAADMDGTFLRHDQTYDIDRFSKVFQRLQANGIPFVIASGNQYFHLANLFTSFPDIIYIAENGAYIRNTQHVFFESTFTESEVNKIISVTTILPNLTVLLSGRDSAYIKQTDNRNYLKNRRQFYDHLRMVDSFDQVSDDIFKVGITCPPDETEDIVARLRHDLAGIAIPTSSGHGDIDLIQPGLHKAAALEELGSVLKIDLNEMCAFGDGGNDLEMIREVGLGVAMCNATPAVKAVADDKTETDFEHQGVLKYLESFIARNQLTQ